MGAGSNGSGVTDSSHAWRSVAAQRHSALAAAYYLNVVLTMYMKEPVVEPPRVRLPLPLGVGIAISAVGVLYLGLFPERLLEFARSLLL